MSTDNINTSSWERIQKGFQETERLLGQKRYNECMIRARQTLEFMVKCLCERFDIMEASLVDMIDALYEHEIINKTTCEHYHKIRMIGNKAVHEEDNLAYNAGQAYHLLSQEIYTFANDFTGKKKRPVPRRESGQRPLLKAILIPPDQELPTLRPEAAPGQAAPQGADVPVPQARPSILAACLKF